ncbi:uncharacterized protein I303_108164 [Kwoniella dejecticola CBS 10117]|uniref:Uncharacterized protein n=1 Tax=Kwoniella dejecticola CBS 10117 TaxID=1296121 RepID=A0A1A5ZY83_9TREE|nr:uncharacterized protein I303_07510 [Kwoniella dejecticola CBS 10117]OBR82743.1 hypothetical protein I303_07510 [Kwoniella dejecticola CBS 10117]
MSPTDADRPMAVRGELRGQLSDIDSILPAPSSVSLPSPAPPQEVPFFSPDLRPVVLRSPPSRHPIQEAPHYPPILPPAKLRSPPFPPPVQEVPAWFPGFSPMKSRSPPSSASVYQVPLATEHQGVPYSPPGVPDAPTTLLPAHEIPPAHHRVPIIRSPAIPHAAITPPPRVTLSPPVNIERPSPCPVIQEAPAFTPPPAEVPPSPTSPDLSQPLWNHYIRQEFPTAPSAVVPTHLPPSTPLVRTRLCTPPVYFPDPASASVPRPRRLSPGPSFTRYNPAPAESVHVPFTRDTRSASPLLATLRLQEETKKPQTGSHVPAEIGTQITCDCHLKQVDRLNRKETADSNAAGLSLEIKAKLSPSTTNVVLLCPISVGLGIITARVFTI